MTRAIVWEILLDRNLEVYDKSIPAGGQWLWKFGLPRTHGAEQLEISVEVHPDHFFMGVFERFDRRTLSPSAASLIDQAEEKDRTTVFSIFHEGVVLKEVGTGRTWEPVRCTGRKQGKKKGPADILSGPF